MTKTAAYGITSRRRGRSLGPGNRIPAFIISPFAKDGTVDHTQYDTTSIIRFITARYDLPVLPDGQPPMGDLTAALDLTH